MSTTPKMLYTLFDTCSSYAQAFMFYTQDVFQCNWKPWYPYYFASFSFTNLMINNNVRSVRLWPANNTSSCRVYLKALPSYRKKGGINVWFKSSKSIIKKGTFTLFFPNNSFFIASIMASECIKIILDMIKWKIYYSMDELDNWSNTTNNSKQSAP